MDLAIRHPEMVGSLILASTTARVTNQTRSSLGLRFSKLTKMTTGGGAFGKSAQPYRAFVHQLEASTKFDARTGSARSTLRPSSCAETGTRSLPKASRRGTLWNQGFEAEGVQRRHTFFWENKKFTEAVLEFLAGLG